MGIDVDTPRSHSNIVSMLDKIEAYQKKNGPEPSIWKSSESEPNHCKGVAMSSVPAEQTNRLQNIAREYLTLSREHVEKAVRLRTHYAGLARDYGMTNQEIGDILGITEARVRQLLRAE